jgi:hypothetical protein
VDRLWLGGEVLQGPDGERDAVSLEKARLLHTEELLSVVVTSIVTRPKWVRVGI